MRSNGSISRCRGSLRQLRHRRMRLAGDGESDDRSRTARDRWKQVQGGETPRHHSHAVVRAAAEVRVRDAASRSRVVSVVGRAWFQLCESCNRVAEPREIAEVALFLASDASSFVR